LVNGAVQVNVSGHNRVFQLKPGEQAISTASNMQLIEVDTESVTGWKDGNFHFNNEHIRSVMKKIARWYDAEVTFEGELPADGFDGTVARSADITQVLRKLELTGRVKFKIAERRIIVMP
jgi:transmembrane sensor